MLLTFELFVFMSVHICLSVRGEVRGQLPQVSSLLPPCGIQGRDSGCQVCASTLHQPSHLLSQGRRMQPLCPGLSGLTWSGATVSLCSVLRGLLRQTACVSSWRRLRAQSRSMAECITFLIAVTRYPRGSNLREGGCIWLTV